MNREFFRAGNLVIIALVSLVAIAAFNALTAHFSLSPAHASRAQNGSNVA